MTKDLCSDEESEEDIGYAVTRSGRISKPHKYAEKFPEAAHLQMNSMEGVWLKPHYCDNPDMFAKLSNGIFYQDTYFSLGVTEEEMNSVEVDVPIQR